MPGYLPPDYIDNQAHTLAEVLPRIVRDLGQQEAAFASGFFNPKAWHYLKDALPLLHRFRLLLGRQPEITFPEDRLDLRRYFKQKLQGDLEDLPFDPEHLRLIESLIAFLKRDSVEVRLFREKFLHAKAYLFPQVAIVGSSNFTPSGFLDNSELNLVRKEEAVAKALLDWFEGKWTEAEDYKGTLIETLDASKFGGKPYTPYEVFIKALYEYFKDRLRPEDPERRLAIEFAEFQVEGLRDAKRLLDRHRGVLIADAVGLGKTYIGMGLLEHYTLGRRRPGYIPKAIIICPAQLRDTLWKPKLDEYGIKATILSQEEVGRKTFDWKRYRNVDMVLVDESHNFRNPGTNRYQNLLKLIATGKRAKLVTLMTATPINTSVWDLYHQIMLLTRGDDAYYREYGISNLRGFFQRVDKGAAELFDLLEETTVRRTRYDIKKRLEQGEKIIIGGQEVRFPERHLQPITYDLVGTYQGFYAEIARCVEALSLVSYNIEAFKKDRDQTNVDRNEALIGILKTLFLKRLESSIAAFEESVKRQQTFQQRFFDLLLQNKLLDSPSHRKILAVEQDEEREETMEEIIAGLPTVSVADYDLREIKNRVMADLKIFGSIIDRLDRIKRSVEDGTERDRKLERVKAVLAGELKGKKVLLFTYYQDTADYLFRSLTDDEEWLEKAGQPRLGLITGDTPTAQRERLIKQFAPISNTSDTTEEGKAEREALQREEISILISTDVLSEGQNLQDAGVLINYDLHWNPVRMIQRAGRIDRIGCLHPVLTIYNCFPEEGLEELLGLVERLQRRIAEIDRNVGLDASVLGEVVHPKSLEDLKRIKAADLRLLEELEQAAELASVEEMKFPLLLYLQALGEERVQEIPMGIHSGKVGPVQGTFLAFRAKDRHFWRFYPADGGEVVTEKRKLFKWIECRKDEPRVVPAHSIFEFLERATTEILQELKIREGTRKIRRPMTGPNLKFYNVLNTPELFAHLDEDVRARLNQVLQEVSLRPFERDPDLRKILDDYLATGDLETFIAQLDAYFTVHDLYQGVLEPLILEAITEADLRLICYELLA